MILISALYLQKLNCLKIFVLVTFCLISQQQDKIESAVQRNKDGLIYSSLDFDETRSAKPPPPKHEETEYTTIDLQKTASLQHELNSS